MATSRLTGETMSESPGLPVRTVTDEIVDFLRTLIHSGELSPGDKLPTERELSTQLGVSRLTLRLGLKALETSGYVYQRRGARGGTFVGELAVPLDQWEERMRNNAQELEEIFDFRIAVETRAAALAADRGTVEDFERMEAAIDKLALADTKSSFRRADAEFHNAVAQAARNRRLERAIRLARGELFSPTDRLVYDTRISDTEVGHRAVLAAIRDRDSRAASVAMEAHIMDARVALRGFLWSDATQD